MSDESSAAADDTAPDGVPAQEAVPDAPAGPAPVGRRSFMRAITGESTTSATAASSTSMARLTHQLGLLVGAVPSRISG